MIIYCVIPLGQVLGNLYLPYNYLAHSSQALSRPKFKQQPFLWCQLGLFFSSFLLSSLCFSFCSAVWETPSNHQYNHHLFIQPSQSRRDNCLFQLGFLDPAVCLNNLSQICNAQFISLLIKCKCFSLASFDVNSCVLSAARLLIMLNKAPDKGQMDTTLSLPFFPNSHNW